jgi:hypothetical protein
MLVSVPCPSAATFSIEPSDDPLTQEAKVMGLAIS